MFAIVLSKIPFYLGLKEPGSCIFYFYLKLTGKKNGYH